MVKLWKICLEIKILLRLSADLPKRPNIGRIFDFQPSIHIHYPCKKFIANTIFPWIVSVETILFWIWPYVLWPLLTVHTSEETIQGRKLFKGGNYLKKYGSITNMGLCHLKRNKLWSYLIQRISLTKLEKYPSLFPIASKSIIKKSQN